MSRRGWGRCLALAVALVAGTAVSGPGKDDVSKFRRLPLYCAGIMVGTSTDDDVRRMYGDGLFAREEGHGGGRYFVDSKHEVTLHVETGVDRAIETLTLTRGVVLPKTLRGGAPVPPAAIARKLTSREHVELGIRINDSPGTVLRTWGKPTADTRRGNLRIIRYRTDYHQNPYVLFYEAEFHFKQGKLTSVRIENGE